jgi:viologen exporter family transport system permease protein
MLALRQYRKTAAMAAVSYLGDSRLFLFEYLLRGLRVAVLLSLWRIILAGKGTVSGMTMQSVLTYTLLAEVFGEQLACRTGIEDTLWDGSIATRFLRPMGTVGQFAAEMVGRWCFGFCLFSLPLFLLSPLLGVDPFPVSPAAGGWFAVSLVLAISIGLALEFFFATLMVALEMGIWIIGSFRSAVGALLSGAVLPLALMPWGIGSVFSWLPFASMASVPLRIYTGTGDPRLLTAVQAGWSLLLWPLAAWIWRANREKLASQGG